MARAGLRTAALARHALHGAARHPHLRRARPERVEVHVERTVAVERAEDAQPVPDAGEQHAELRPAGQPAGSLELRRGDEPHARLARRNGGGEIDGQLLQPGDGGQFRPALRGAEAGGGQRGDGLHEARDHGVAHREQVQAEVEGLAAFEPPPIQMPGAQHEGPRPVGEAAGTAAALEGLEVLRVVALEAPLAALRVRARRQASDFPQREAQRAAQRVGGLALREAHGVAGHQRKAQRVQLERHGADHPSACTGAMSANWLEANRANGDERVPIPLRACGLARRCARAPAFSILARKTRC